MTADAGRAIEWGRLRGVDLLRASGVVGSRVGATPVTSGTVARGVCNAPVSSPIVVGGDSVGDPTLAAKAAAGEA